MDIFDTHTHIDFFDDISAAVQGYKSSGIHALFVTHLPEIYKKHLNSELGLDDTIRLCLGYHPMVSDEYPFDLNLFKELSHTTNYIGEIGLDKSRYSPDINLQLNAFREILNISASKVLTIHSRKAERLVFENLKEFSIRYAVFHWYTGPLGLIDEIAGSGYFFSVNPSMLSSASGRKVLSRIPLDNMLFETDAPFGKHGKKVITPDLIRTSFDELSSFLNEPDLSHIMRSNMGRLLRARRDGFFIQ